MTIKQALTITRLNGSLSGILCPLTTHTSNVDNTLTDKMSLTFPDHLPGT